MRLKQAFSIVTMVVVFVVGASAAEREDLERTMKTMNRAYKALVKQVADKSKNADSLKQLAELEAATLKAKGEEPDHLEGSAEKRAELLKDYRSRMAACLMTEAEVEQALLDDDNEKAKKKLDELTDTMKSGHEAFRPHDHD